MALIPQAQPTDSRQYEIYSPETQEIYVFNRFGQHLATKNIVTGETIYTFLYNVNMSNGKLSSVTDSAGNKVQILRDYSSQVKTIENSQAQKFNLKMSRVRMLQEFATPEGYNLTFDYHGSTGLIKSRQDSSGRSSVYSYDEFGRLTMAVSPTGQVVTLTFDLSQKGASVKVTRDDNLPEVVLIKGSSIYKRQGSKTFLVIFSFLSILHSTWVRVREAIPSSRSSSSSSSKRKLFSQPFGWMAGYISVPVIYL